MQLIKDSFHDNIEADRGASDNLRADTSGLSSETQTVEGEEKIQPFEFVGQTGRSRGSENPTAGTCKPTHLSFFFKNVIFN